PLTELPNRALFLDRLALALARLRRKPSSLAVLFADVDRFKVVNDSLGHDAGDRLLVALARRLREVLRPGDTLARFGGDEFAVLCEDVSHDEVATIAERMIEVLGEPFSAGGGEVFATISIGISLAEESGTIVAVGRWVLGEACQQAATWRGSGDRPAVSVNLSAREMARPDLVEVVAEALDSSGLDADRLWLEITESVLMDDADL